ncbi:MAG TPA: sugar ABC transporter ATP-binding protein [Candidatus Limnocylindria bacterium]|nr:sugar ABC transporter ATP-binding protein [Candidatus Limnocylindria bacterium]
MEGIDKAFPGVRALSGARFELRGGEVHALVGENGAGKSTLMKVLTGIYQKDAGRVEVMGREVNVHSAREAQALGISVIHQELNLMKDLTIAENIYIGREPKSGFMLDKRRQNALTRELLASLRIDLDPETPVKSLTVAKQQMVEIAKALSFPDTRIMIMDEPTAALTDSEIEDLFRFIRALKQRGAGIVYISHRMDELKRISDRITVMRDGQYVGTVNTNETTLGAIIGMMVGRVIYEQPKTHSAVPADAPVVLEVRNLFSTQVFGASFTLRRGEILGIAGLMGAGRTELARLISGADRKISGDILIHGRPADVSSPRAAVRSGIGYLSEDRKQFGLCLGMSVANNVALSSLDSFCNGPVVDDRAIRKVAGEYRERMDIRTPSVDTQAISLSGGNQQKVVISKWLVRDCDVLIFDEPTRGIDVGAKSEIYKLMAALAEAGKSIIMISSELPELLRMSDRIAVMCEGEITGILGIEEATQEKVMMLATPGARVRE